MKSLCIKTNNPNLLDYLLSELNAINFNDICFSSNKFKNYKNVIIHYNGKNNIQFYSTISSILSFLVIDELEESLLKRLLIQNYFYFDAIEKNKILEICFDIMSEDFTKIFDEKFNSLYDSFYNFISSHKSIVLQGFVNFRLKKYMSILDNIVNESVNTFIIEKEYLEFISLLKLYINSQNSTCNIIHIIYSSSNSILLDENKEPINTSNDIFTAKYLSDITFSSNDYILNTLLTLIPKKIYIHLVDNYIDDFINTLKLIFENRIILCTDCNICRVISQKHSNKYL